MTALILSHSRQCAPRLALSRKGHEEQILLLPMATATAVDPLLPAREEARREIKKIKMMPLSGEKRPMLQLKLIFKGH